MSNFVFDDDRFTTEAKTEALPGSLKSNWPDLGPGKADRKEKILYFADNTKGMTIGKSEIYAVALALAGSPQRVREEILTENGIQTENRNRREDVRFGHITREM